MKLDRIEIPGEREARERTWQLARAAFAEREPVPRPRRRLGPALALGLAAAVVAVAFTPPGRAVVESVRDAIGVESAEEALFSLPAPGRLLVVSDGGAWAVSQDGAKRRLGDYADAACSPFGRFVVAAGEDELVALEPGGDVRWKLSRPDVGSPQWGGTQSDTRIAYGSRGTVRVVAGDGTGDRSLGPGRAAAWRPGAGFVLAVARGAAVVAIDLETRRALWRLSGIVARDLAWSTDGKLLLAATARGYELLLGSGSFLSGADRGVVAAAFAPRGHALATVRRTTRGSEVRVDGTLRFQGTGTFGEVTWSPDGRWLAVSWPAADQLVFVRASGPRRIEAAANLSRQFESASTPRLAAWCPVAP